MDEQLRAELKINYPQNFDIISKAYNFAEKAHSGQKRASGEEYIIHPKEVAEILIELGLDYSTVCAAYLHDVLEDTSIGEAELRKIFGDEITNLVLGVTKLDKLTFKSVAEEEAENFRKMFLATAKDIRVLVIKLADRLHNMRSLRFLNEEKQQRIAKETLDIYAPLAGRLGMSRLKVELEDLCLKYLEPDIYTFLDESIKMKIEERREFLNFIISDITEMMKSSGIKGEVFGRPKHYYSIYKKMRAQKKTIDQIYDILAVRILVDDIESCYDMLGKIHHNWKPVPGRIKDYIAMPKINKYQSLHTTVITQFGQPFEIQIRTFEMNKTAEYGIAAHWKYKENFTSAVTPEDKLTWIREVMEWEDGLTDSEEFLESMKIDLYSREVLVFTPKGDVRSLPLNATPLDFAYAIHTEVGNKCTGAKVNGRIVPLNSELKTNDVVEIITSGASKGPSWDWLKIVKSPSARAKIKQFFKREMKDDNIKIGREMLEKEAKKRGFEFSELLAKDNFEKLCAKLYFNSEDEMYASVGFGAVSCNQILFKLIDYYKKIKAVLIPKIQSPDKKDKSNDVIIKGMSNILLKYGGCCNPLPGDDIIGYISRGRGVIVHRKDCSNIVKTETDRLIEAKWAVKNESKFLASIKIHIKDEEGILAKVTSIVANMHIGITSITGRIYKDGVALIDLTVKIASKTDLNNLISNLKTDHRVIDIFRTTV